MAQDPALTTQRLHQPVHPDEEVAGTGRRNAEGMSLDGTCWGTAATEPASISPLSPAPPLFQTLPCEDSTGLDLLSSVAEALEGRHRASARPEAAAESQRHPHACHSRWLQRPSVFQDTAEVLQAFEAATEEAEAAARAALNTWRAASYSADLPTSNLGTSLTVESCPLSTTCLGTK
jgi:hypothetical protein